MNEKSSLRDKILKSSALRELAKERSSKRHKSGNQKEEHVTKESDDDEESDRLEQERRLARAKSANDGLLSILPEPKNSSAFGPTIRLDKLLKMPDRAQQVMTDKSEDAPEKITDDGMVEVDIGKVIGDVTPNLIKDITIERAKPGAVVVPKGREKQKNQITYLAQLGKANELERKEQAAQARMNKAAARSKYGW